MIKGSFLKHVSVLFSGLALVQVINFLFSLVLPKYFTPSDFALFGIFSSIVFILAEVCNAKLDIAVMLAKEPEESKKIIRAAHTFSVGFSIFTILLSIILAVIYTPIYLLLIPCVLAYGLHQPILVWLNQQEKYSSINLFRTLQVISTACITLLLGILKVPQALIIGFCSGLIIASLYVLKFIPFRYNLADLKYALQQYSQFPAFGTWSSLLNNLSKNSIPILLNSFFSKNEVGYYSYATRLLNAPTGMYSSAVSQVYFKNAVTANMEDLRTQTVQLMKLSFLLGIIPSILVLFFGKAIFIFLFKPEWMQAGMVAQYLILWYFIGIISGPLSVLLDIQYKLKAELFYNLLLFLLRGVAILTGAYFHNFYLSILLVSVVGFIMNVLLINYILYLINRD